ncbi:MAG: MerR family transcriptional regulator [Candidatus Omnitrophica bacterium]|nr:MerR family transcriptional regulator [Candidatus Omnitrophota bacterium]MCM8793737.1 MerR family transcriptional regulator [Candidatus Omnitrophota bacterium]
MSKGCFKIPSDEPVFVISVVSRLVNLPEWTLRILDRQGVVCPKKTRGKTRLYCLRDLEKLVYIRYLMEEKGINIKGIKFILEREEKFSFKGKGRKKGGESYGPD